MNIFEFFGLKKTKSEEIKETTEGDSVSLYFQEEWPIADVIYSSSSLRKAFVGWIYRIISTIANSIAAVNWYVIDQRDKRIEHQALRLLQKPNPLQNGYTFKLVLMQNLEIFGRALIKVERNGYGKPIALWPLATSQYQKVYDEKTGTVSYQCMDGTTLDDTDIIDIYYPSPFIFWQAKSPVSAALYEFELDLNAKKRLLGLFKKGAIPSTIINIPNATAKQIEDLQKKWSSDLTGPESAGAIEITRAAQIQVHPLSITPEQLKVLEAQKYMRDFLIQLWSVPPEILGITENSNRATAYQAQLLYARNVLVPRLELLKNALNSDYLWKYWRREKVYFDYENVIPADKELQLREDMIYLKYGVYTINDIRRRKGLPEVSYGEKPWLPMNLLPVSDDIRYKIGLTTIRNTELQEAILEEFEDDVKKVFDYKTLRQTIEKWLKRFNLEGDYRMPVDVNFANIFEIVHVINKVINTVAAKYKPDLKFYLSKTTKKTIPFDKFYKFDGYLARWCADMTLPERLKEIGITIPIFLEKNLDDEVDKNE